MIPAIPAVAIAGFQTGLGIIGGLTAPFLIVEAYDYMSGMYNGMTTDQKIKKKKRKGTKVCKTKKAKAKRG